MLEQPKERTPELKFRKRGSPQRKTWRWLNLGHIAEGAIIQWGKVSVSCLGREGQRSEYNRCPSCLSRSLGVNVVVDVSALRPLWPMRSSCFLVAVPCRGVGHCDRCLCGQVVKGQRVVTDPLRLGEIGRLPSVGGDLV